MNNGTGANRGLNLLVAIFGAGVLGLLAVHPVGASPQETRIGPGMAVTMLAMTDDPSHPVMPPVEAGATQTSEPGDSQPDEETAQEPSSDAPAVAGSEGPPAGAAPSAQPAPDNGPGPQRAGRQMALTDPPLPRPRHSADPGEGATDLESQFETDSGHDDPGAPAPGGDTSTLGLENGNLDSSDLDGPDRAATGLEPDDEFVPIPEAEEAIREELEMGPRPSFPLTVAARLTEGGARIPEGLVWRVYRARPASNGAFEMVDKSRDPEPSFLLPAEDYIVHVAYGLANTAKRIALNTGPVSEEIALDAGGLRISCVDAFDQQLPERQVSLSIYSSEEDEYGQRRVILEQANPRRIIRLNPGTYHVVSRYGDANAVIRADVQVRAGELTEARIQHRAAEITLKLVNEIGGEALANTTWTILSQDGETITESYGAFPSHVLMTGEYTAVARHEGRMFNRDFDVTPGGNREIELVAR